MRDFLTQKYYTGKILGFLHPVVLPRGSSKIGVKTKSKKCEFKYIGQTYEVKIKYEGFTMDISFTELTLYGVRKQGN